MGCFATKKWPPISEMVSFWIHESQGRAKMAAGSRKNLRLSALRQKQYYDQGCGEPQFHPSWAVSVAILPSLCKTEIWQELEKAIFSD